MLVYDIESDGLLDTISKVHCINAIDRSNGREYRFTDHEFYQNVDGSVSDEATPRDGTIAMALEMLSAPRVIGGQNIIGYDFPALSIVYPEFKPHPHAKIVDSQVMSQVLYPTLKDKDFASARKGKASKALVAKGKAGSHALGSWGIRIGGHQKADFNPKDYGHTWATMPFTKVMDDYCMQDVRTNVNVFKFFEHREELFTTEALDTEMKVAEIIGRQERFGWLFDTEGAKKLTHTLQARKAELEQSLRNSFAPFYVRSQTKVHRPKKDQRRFVQSKYGGDTRVVKEDTGETYMHTFKSGLSKERKLYKKVKQRGWWEYADEAAPQTKVKITLFNPASRVHIANRLMTLFDWAPVEFTKDNKPKLDEDTLKSLTYPEAKLIQEYLMVDKRLGQVAEGKQAWLKQVKSDGRMHGRVNPLGTITTRMTHFGPNVAQVPSSKKPYGVECRSLFCVPAGKKQVGCDAEGLELRMLAHYMARYDNGEYMRAVTSGNKADGTDAHTLNMKAILFNSRDHAKTWFYAFLYGSGDFNLGTIVVEDFSEEKRERFYAKYPAGNKRNAAITKLGAKSRSRIIDGLPALGKLLKAVAKSAAKYGFLRALDGRRITVRHKHAALNTLLQGNGALVMKVALIILDRRLQEEEGFTPGEEYEYTGNIHDEIQLEVAEEHAETVGRLAADAIRQAGEHFNLRCPLAGAYDIGESWADTH